MDFQEVIRALGNVAFDGLVMPDHVGKPDAEGSSNQVYAFVYSYSRFLITPSIIFTIIISPNYPFRYYAIK